MFARPMTTPDTVDLMITAAITAVVPSVASELEQLDPTLDLWQELGLDSIDYIAIIERLSLAVGRDIPARDAPRLISLAGLRGYLSSLSTPTDAAMVATAEDGSAGSG